MNPAAFRALMLLPVLAPVLPAQGPSSPLLGHWQGALQVPGGELELQVRFLLRQGILAGTISIPRQGAKDLPLTGLRAGDGAVAFALAGVPGDPRFQGTLLGPDRIEGTLTQAGQRLTFHLVRQAQAPPPPPAAAPDPADREVAFAGFNGRTLKGSVRRGAGQGWFAVLVAGSGPTDRDWSNPLIPKPSHAGRAFAAWLAEQGIGSLRYDKRFIGSRDPGLDIGLEAQSGDVAAALKAARALPEAQGRRILLVGHSEGALLALLNGNGGDGLLLLALPGQALAAQVLEQVRNQFTGAGAPLATSRPNLGHLEAVLEAVRSRREPPAPGPEVLPAIAALGTQLASPLHRDFFRSVMDLDPWRLASRVAVPFAAAWGDRDVQCWKPVIPQGFPGQVIDLPGANHLLRREGRPFRELDPGAALAGYGDDTPLADLAPLAGWLRGLK